MHLVKAMVFPVVMYGCESCTEELMLFNCGVGEDSWESLGSVLNIHLVDWCWSFNNLATWCKEHTHLKRPWCWERLKAGEGADRSWGSWTASPTQWTWVRINSQRWWWTGKPGVLQSFGVAKSLTRLSDWIDLYMESKKQYKGTYFKNWLTYIKQTLVTNRESRGRIRYEFFKKCKTTVKWHRDQDQTACSQAPVPWKVTIRDKCYQLAKGSPYRHAIVSFFFFF